MGVKTILVVCRFEENKDVQGGSLKVFLAMSSTHIWEFRTIDIKAPFLQGNIIKQEMFLKPMLLRKLWLQKNVFGWNDASRSLYLSV